MADSKISDLASASTLDGTETAVVVQGGTTKKSLLSAVLTYMGITLAPKASPTFTGTPAAPTASGGTNTTQVATTAFVTTAVAGAGGYTQGAYANNSADVTISHGTLTVLSFDSERYDTDAIHSTSSNTSRLTCTTAGTYMIWGGSVWASNSTGVRFLNLRLNGTTDIGYNQVSASANSFIQISTIYSLSINDYVELLTYQNSGGDLSALQNNPYAGLSMQRIG